MTQASTEQCIRRLFLSVEIILLFCFFTCFGVSSCNPLSQKSLVDNTSSFFFVFSFHHCCCVCLHIVAMFGRLSKQRNIPRPNIGTDKSFRCDLCSTEPLFTLCLFLSLPTPVAAIHTPFGLSVSIFWPFLFFVVLPICSLSRFFHIFSVTILLTFFSFCYISCCSFFLFIHHSLMSLSLYLQYVPFTICLSLPQSPSPFFSSPSPHISNMTPSPPSLSLFHSHSQFLFQRSFPKLYWYDSLKQWNSVATSDIQFQY